MKKILLKRKSIFFISTLVILIDQLSKLLVIQLLKSQQSINLIPQLINLRLVQNTGAAFSLFENKTPFLGFLSLCVTIGLVMWIWKSKPLPLLRGLSFSFLLGGCVGNGLDRWRLGYVNDFLELTNINFPIFNGADIAINIAVFCLVIETVSKQNSPHHQTY